MNTDLHSAGDVKQSGENMPLSRNDSPRIAGETSTNNKDVTVLSTQGLPMPQGFEAYLDSQSLESVVDLKISRFLDQIGTYYPENLHDLIIKKVEKPLVSQILKRVGGNQVHAARILGINRNTLRKKMKIYGLL